MKTPRGLDIAEGPSCAKSGVSNRSKKASYSITSSRCSVVSRVWRRPICSRYFDNDLMTSSRAVP
jgi:hypothetical protein